MRQIPEKTFTKSKVKGLKREEHNPLEHDHLMPPRGRLILPISEGHAVLLVVSAVQIGLNGLLSGDLTLLRQTSASGLVLSIMIYLIYEMIHLFL